MEQGALLLVVAYHGRNCNPASKFGQVYCYVTGSARTLRPTFNAYDRYRCFGRDSLHLTPNVAIQHEIAHYQDTRSLKTFTDCVDQLLNISKHDCYAPSMTPRSTHTTCDQLGCALPEFLPQPDSEQ